MRAKSMVLLVVLGLGAAMGCVLGAGQLGAPALEPGKPPAKAALVELDGADSKIDKREFVRVMDSDAWMDLWCRHAGVPKDRAAWSGSYPKIDFSRCMVVAFFRGKAVNTRGEELQSADVVDGKLRLRFRSGWYQTMSLSGEDKGEPAVSYGIWVLPRSADAVVVEEDVQHLIGKPPVWKEQASFDAVKD